MDYTPKIKNTGYWYSNDTIFHVRCEPLCDWIIEFLKHDKDKPLFDFGCGNGHYLKKLSENGFVKLTGFEGKIPVNKEHNNIIQQDLTLPFNTKEKGNCLFLEVAEHIPSIYEQTLLNNVVSACNNYLIMSWAIRSQDGHGHVNCLNNDEVINRLLRMNMIFLQKETLDARNSIPDNNPYPWFKNTTLIFKKK